MKEGSARWCHPAELRGGTRCCKLPVRVMQKPLLLLLLGLGPVFSINLSQKNQLLILICRKTPNTLWNSAEGDPSAHLLSHPMAQLDPDPPQHGRPCIREVRGAEAHRSCRHLPAVILAALGYSLRALMNFVRSSSLYRFIRGSQPGTNYDVVRTLINSYFKILGLVFIFQFFPFFLFFFFLRQQNSY